MVSVDPARLSSQFGPHSMFFKGFPLIWERACATGSALEPAGADNNLS